MSNGFLGKLGNVVKLTLGLMGIAWVLVQAGMILQEQKTGNAELRELNTSMKTVLSRLSNLEASREDLQRLNYEQARQLNEVVALAQTSARAVERHIQDEKNNRWFVYQRLNALDHLGAGGGKR